MSSVPPPEDSKSKNLQLALVQRNPWYMLLASLPALVGFLFLTLGLGTGQHVLLGIVPQLFFISAALFTVFWIRNPKPLEIEGDLEVDEKGVRRGTALVLPRERIKAGFVVPRPDKRPIVRLDKNGIGPAMEIRVENEDEGREILRRLSLDASQTIASFVLPSRLFGDKGMRVRFGLVAFGFFAILRTINGLLGLKSPFAATLLALLPLGVAVVAILMRTRLRVGADGVHLRWFRTERFIPFGEIEQIESYEESGSRRRRWAGVRLHLQAGEIITLPISATGEIGGPRLRLVTHRLQQAHADHNRGSRASAEARLMRGERAMPAWIRELRREGSGAAAHHRQAPIPMDRLLELAEDPHADPVMRANAAIALGANTEHQELRSRLRVAAQATASPRLRVALEKAGAVDDEAALAEALAEVEAEAKKSARQK